MRILLTLIFLILTTTSSLAQNEGLIFWPNNGYEPEGHPSALKLYPFLEFGFGDSPMPLPSEFQAWAEANNWVKKADGGGKHHIIIAMGAWKEWQPTGLFERGPGIPVTIEDIAYHVRKGMSGWRKPVLSQWWGMYLQCIRNLDYDIGVVLMDIESGSCTSTMKYVTEWGPEQVVGFLESEFEYFSMTDSGNPFGIEKTFGATEPTKWITMLEVINKLYANERHARKLPQLDLVALNATNSWGVRRNEQQHLIWRHYVMAQNAKRMSETFGGMARLFYPDVIVNNYDYSTYPSNTAPRITVPHGHPRHNSAIDGNSAPVLYLLTGYDFKTNDDAMASLYPCLPFDPEEAHNVIPWIAGPHREGQAGWSVEAGVPNKSFEQLRDRCRAAGCKYIGVF